MTTISQFSVSGFIKELRNPGIWLKTGPVKTHVRTSIESVGAAIHLLYSDFQLAENHAFADFHVRLLRPRNLRRWYRPQVLFHFEDQSLFKPLSLKQGFAMFEWCMNWCISSHAHQYLIIHAAVLERNGYAAILAAPPGSGKSTLTAALANRGWRLLSDELTLIDPASGLVIPLARPISLKNESIDVLRDFAPHAVIGPAASDTAKGTVAHMKPPADSVARMAEPALPRWVFFPKFEAGASTLLRHRPKGEALLHLGDNAFNYSLLGLTGFNALSSLIDKAECFDFTYSKLDEAIAVFDSLSSTVVQEEKKRKDDTKSRTNCVVLS
jgi:HprK-related kinase A